MPASTDVATLPPSGDQLPWERNDLLPEKPVDSDYGYLLGKKLHPCTQEELITRCESKDVREVTLVWHPGASRVVPASEVEILFESVKKRKLASQKTSLGFAIFFIGFYGLMLLTMGVRRESWYLLLLIVFGVIPFCEGWIALGKLKRLGWKDVLQERCDGRFGIWIGLQKAKWAWILLGLILLVAGGQVYIGRDRGIASAGLVKDAVWEGELGRLMTGTLLHAHPLHLLLNAFSLFFLVKVMEALATRYHAALVFFVSALTGSVFSLFLLDATSVGASGGIMGFIGFLFVLGLRQRTAIPKNYTKSLATAILLLAVTGIVGVNFIDNAAHLGGLVGGLLLGLFLIPKKDRSLPLPAPFALRLTGWASLILTLGFGVLTLYRFILRH